MKMRMKPRRGEKILCLSRGENVTILEPVGKTQIRVLNALGFLETISKNDLALPIIDTADYEKLES